MDNYNFSWVNPLFRLGHGFNSLVSHVLQWLLEICWELSELSELSGVMLVLIQVLQMQG